jgi:holo-[acyl-carrier protein] synthase
VCLNEAGKGKAYFYCGEFMDEWNIGVDVVEVAQFRWLDYFGHKRFYERVFTPKEIKYCLSFKTPAPHFAVNFAGKEAVYKAINMFYDVRLRDIEILRDEKGAPHVNLHVNRCDVKNESEGMFLPLEVKVSLSHSSSYAVAFAVVKIPSELMRKHKGQRRVGTPR